MSCLQIRIDTDLFRELAERHAPVSWGLRKALGESLLRTRFEDSHERFAEARGIKRHRLLDEHEIDEIFHPRALATVAVGSRVCVDLLGDVLLERQDRDLHRIDVCERKKVRSMHALGLPTQGIGETDIERYVLERSAGELRTHPIPNRASVLLLGDPPDLLDREHEEVVERNGLACDEIFGRGFLVVVTNEVHVFRCARAFPHPEVERECAFEDPAIRRSDREACEESVEDDRLPKSDQRDTFFAPLIEQTLFESLPKTPVRSCTSFPHSLEGLRDESFNTGSARPRALEELLPRRETTGNGGFDGSLDLLRSSSSLGGINDRADGRRNADPIPDDHVLARKWSLGCVKNDAGPSPSIALRARHRDVHGIGHGLRELEEVERALVRNSGLVCFIAEPSGEHFLSR